MNARDIESALLTRCASVAREAVPSDQGARDQREANVFRLAAMVVQSRYSRESAALMRVSDRYFAIHPEQKLDAGEVVRRGWVLSLPRFREMLSHEFRGH